MMELLAAIGVTMIGIAAIVISWPAALVAGLGSAALGYALFHDPETE